MHPSSSPRPVPPYPSFTPAASPKKKIKTKQNKNIANKPTETRIKLGKQKKKPSLLLHLSCLSYTFSFILEALGAVCHTVYLSPLAGL